MVDVLQEEKVQQVNHLFEEIDDRRRVSMNQNLLRIVHISANSESADIFKQCSLKPFQ